MRPRRQRSLVVLLTFVTAVVAACGSEPEASPDDLIGKWRSGAAVTWQVDADLIIANGAFGRVESTYSATGTTLETTDVSGSNACAANLVGTYEWAIVDDELTINVVSDACRGRGRAMDGRQFIRQE